MTIWQFNKRLTRRLLLWSATSIGLGLRFMREVDGYSQGLGAQFVGWGLIDALIALVGGGLSARRRRLPGASTAEQEAVEARNLARLLLVNTFLDIFYVLGGWALARTRGAADRRVRGHGRGIMAQGAFLFLFDLFHYLIMPRPDRGPVAVPPEAVSD